MLKGKQLILATRQYARENRARSWMHFLLTGALIAFAYFLLFRFQWLPLQVGISITIGLLLVRMFMICHDYHHCAILQKSSTARIFFTFYGMFVLAPASIWKRSHNYHHANNAKLYTSSIGSYPIMTRKDFMAAGKGEQKTYLFTRHPLTILFGYFFTFVWGMCFLSLIRNPKKHWDSAIALLLHFSVFLLVFLKFGLTMTVLAVLVPALISSAIGSYLFYAQHNFPGVTHADKNNWTYANAAMNSSSYMRCGPIMRWFTANIGFHHIHHANARIPFYRLPEVYRDMPEFQAARVTSLRPGDIAACLSLKVWDPEENRMLTRKELRGM